MPIDAFQDSIDLQVRVLDPVAPTPSSYPYPALQLTDQFHVREFETIILEHEYLRVSILPELGGRIFSIFDKRTNSEIFEPCQSVDCVLSGPRGADWRQGYNFQYGPEPRLNALGTVHHAVQPNEQGDPTVRLGEFIGGNGMSHTLMIGLAPERAAITIRVIAQNRTLAPLPFDGQFRFSGLLSPGAHLFANASEGVIYAPNEATHCLLGVEIALAPRQSHEAEFELVPYSGLGGLATLGPDFGFSSDNDQWHLQVPVARLGQRVAIKTESGETREAVLDLFPEKVVAIPLAELGGRVVEAAFLDNRGQVISRLPEQTTSKFVPNPHAITPRSLVSEAECRVAIADPYWRPAAHLRLARQYSLVDKLRSQLHYEQALLFNGDDALAWCEKAVAANQEPDEESAELLNAHFISPLEPLLRAAQFLAQGHQAEKSPIVAPLAAEPEEFIEVACLLLEANLFEEASRWIDEALRHVDLAMLRYLRAYMLISRSKLAIEAAEEMRRAAALSGRPPLPWRGMEIVALKAVAATFPEDAEARRLLSGIQ